MFEKYGDILTVRELCTLLRIGKNTAYKLLRSKTIPNVRVGHKYIIPKTGLMDFLNAQ